jgi:hypothetical protein
MKTRALSQPFERWADQRPRLGHVPEEFAGIFRVLSQVHVSVAPAFPAVAIFVGVGRQLIEVAARRMGELVVIVLDVHLHRESEVLQVALAGGALGLIFRFFQSGHQDSHENGDDGDDNEELDKCEGTRSSHESCSLSDRSCRLVLRRPCVDVALGGAISMFSYHHYRRNGLV